MSVLNAKQARIFRITHIDNLPHRRMPVDALLGIACYNEKARKAIEEQVGQRALDLRVKTVPKWYF